MGTWLLKTEAGDDGAVIKSLILLLGNNNKEHAALRQIRG
jgi:hypothetical protein